ncbi:MAG: SDR family oxidoreductase [Rickettsiales bacterium]|jgi:pteridine reductase|nr:SDR family oxidoreductase [Rickettsiales bacterium]
MAKAVLITGGARRLGKEMALHLAAKGYDIALHYNRSASEANYVARRTQELGAKCELIQADLEDGNSYESLIRQAHGAFPHLSALVNNASVFDTGSFLDGDVALYEKEFRTNTQAPIFLTQAFAQIIGKGHVVNMLDTCVTQHKHSYFYYLLSKKTLYEFTKMAAVDLAPHIRVNGVAPGYILPADGWGEDYRVKLETRLPMKRIATVSDIVQAVELLITTDAMTGQCLFIDGGEHLL